ncbi:amino acid permease [Pelagicoccus sp. NFK12]|uniref:Amino acid permease n=1 Tax=Pelagicoccus enzymogenes TaxID=2773457 RepID=A0A927III3_9BACT|nr:amino acid permease [Pelagicoccus enzymogenes]MBD5780793.1 amino acid permease [Pelagicoccus enzymogenes]MDQ8200471.1 amino acid permease [Pelagicoccus enzymogenes]
MEKPAQKFGTFGGVFVPNVLTILGVILFLRSGWVVGNAGLLGAIAMLCIANLVTFISALSLSAIATNTKAQGGGAYFLVSRSLGLEFGGAIGMPLYLAQAISVAFYVVGFTESVQYLFPDLDARAFSLITLGAITVVAWIGASVAVKAQYLILATLAVSLASFFVGFQISDGWEARSEPAYIEGQSFWSVFAIFFPAVTGIMSGVSMSGDLKDPTKSIPRGTLWAVGATFVVYLMQLVWLSLGASREDLIENALVMKTISVAPPLVIAGLWAATLSSALASLVAAPRTMQALAKDRVMPRFLAKGHGPSKEPRIALVLSAGISVICVWVGDLNLIAPLISMFFLATYGAVNLVAALESWTSNPTYRPTFKVHWLVSLVGAIACFGIMLLLNPLATVAAVALIVTAYTVLARRSYRTAWGDMRSGFWFAVARMGLLKLYSSRQHQRNWRPAILMLMSNLKENSQLLRFGRYLEANKGVLFLSHIIIGDWKNSLERQKALTRQMDERILEERMSAFSKVVVAKDFEQGVTSLLQGSGLGNLQPNTLMIEWGSGWLRDHDFPSTVHQALEMETNLLVYSKAKEPDSHLYSVIDVWWSARANGSMMITLAHLMQSNRAWQEARIRILRIIRDEEGRAAAEAGMAELLKDSRIEVEPVIVVSKDPPLESIARESARSAVTFVGVSVRTLEEKAGPLSSYAPLVDSIQGHLFLTKNWHDLEL